MNPITLPVAELKPTLAGLSKVISKRITLPVLGCVRIERTHEGRIELTGTDLDRSATVQLSTADSGDPTSILVPLEDLTNLTKGCGRTESLLLTKIDGDKAAIRFPVAGQLLEHHCDSLPVTEFPTLEEVPGNAVALNATLRQSIHEAIACASTDETRLIINGAFLDVSKKDAHYVVGTDGRHLFSSNSFTLALPHSLIIPSHPFIGWKGFNEDGDWHLRIRPAGKDQPPVMELSSEHWRYVCRSYDGNYPNWRQVVPTGRDITCSIEIPAENVEAVIQTIARLPDHDDRFHTLGIEVKDGRVAVLTKASLEQPWTAIETKGVKATGTSVTTFVNRQLMLKALRFGLTRVDMIDALSPVRFCAGGRQMIVMPIRVEPIAEPAPKPANPPPPPPIPAVAAINPPSQPAEPTKEKKPTMPENNIPTTTGVKRPIANAEEPKPALDAALAQLEGVRGDFRNVVVGLNKLGDLLKQVQRENKSSEKEISSVRQTLRQLQAVRI